MTKAKTTKLTVHVVLDRSGSMNRIKDDTIGAFNSYVETLAKEAPDSRLSLTIFDSQSVDTITDNAVIGEVPKLNATTYQPRGSTPLYDAIGKVVGLLGDAKGKNKALVVLTDGQENASREYTKDAIKKLLDEKQEKSNWLVLYLGANQDAFAEGAKFGTQAATTLNYDTANMRGTMAVAAASTLRYAASGNRADATFTSAERKKAKATS